MTDQNSALEPQHIIRKNELQKEKRSIKPFKTNFNLNYI
jgi:hypothetical protein